jgi:tetratricopeptide (TPR) repeat protein
MGRYEEAIAELKRAQELDPLSLIINAVLGLMYSDNRQADQAIQQLRKTIEMDPNFMPAHFFLASEYERVGMFNEAADQYGKAIIITGRSNEDVSKYLAVVKTAYKTSGPKGYWRTLAELTAKVQTQGSTRPATLAGVWAQAGETDKAFALLEEGYQQRDEEILRLKNWIFDPIKSDPRYKDLLRRVGLPEN